MPSPHLMVMALIKSFLLMLFLFWRVFLGRYDLSSLALMISGIIIYISILSTLVVVPLIVLLEIVVNVLALQLKAVIQLLSLC